MTDAQAIKHLQRRITALERTLATFIAWTGSAANHPLSLRETKQLLDMIGGEVEPAEKVIS